MVERSVTMKRCTGCGKTLQASAFVKHRQSADGLYSRCKECHLGDQARFPRKTVEGGSRRTPQTNLPGQKRCAACKQDLPIEAFGRRTASSDGLHHWCKACNAMKVRAQRETLTTERITRPPQVPASGMKYCSACEQTLPLAEFGKRTASSDGLHYWCKACNAMKVRAQRGVIQAQPRTPPPSGQKQCASCEKTLPIEAFGKRSASPDGLHYWCRSCNSLRVMKQREAIKSRPPRPPVSGRKRCGSCKQELPIEAFGNRAVSSDGLHYWCKSCVAERNREWRESNPEIWRPKHRERQNRRLRRISENGGDLNDYEWERILRRYDHRCVACGRKGDITMDHIVPIAKGGRHSAENMQPLCRSCNSSKGSSIIDYRPDREG